MHSTPPFLFIVVRSPVPHKRQKACNREMTIFNNENEKNQTRNGDKREVADAAVVTTMYNTIPHIKAVRMTKTVRRRRRRHTCRQLATVNKFAYCAHFDILISFETVLPPPYCSQRLRPKLTSSTRNN